MTLQFLADGYTVSQTKLNVSDRTVRRGLIGCRPRSGPHPTRRQGLTVWRKTIKDNSAVKGHRYTENRRVYFILLGNPRKASPESQNGPRGDCNKAQAQDRL